MEAYSAVNLKSILKSKHKNGQPELSSVWSKPHILLRTLNFCSGELAVYAPSILCSAGTLCEGLMILLIA